MIAELLAQLGSSSDEIADSLRKAGISGRQRSVCYCPIANWLKIQPEIIAPRVAPDRIVVFWGSVDDKRIAEKTPAAVQDFITDFDAGKYPQLDQDIRDFVEAW